MRTMARPGTRTRKTARRTRSEFHKYPLGKNDEAAPPAYGPGCPESAQGFPLLRLSLLARDRLCVLLPGAFENLWREVRRWPVN